ncbi:hypothetical protein [Arthrobacter sp. SAFR-014]|uniref:hypothetical protein n=1 Tax=unclassified Arthrobacter TaxID=235627 RepID=UPI003F7B7711
MHIEPPAAGLLAQIIPTLLIVLALEQRAGLHRGRRGFWSEVHFLVRTAAIFLNLSTTFVCLVIVITDSDFKGPSAIVVDSGILTSLVFLFLAFFFMVFGLLKKEVDDYFAPLAHPSNLGVDPGGSEHQKACSESDTR